MLRGGNAFDIQSSNDFIMKVPLQLPVGMQCNHNLDIHIQWDAVLSLWNMNINFVTNWH